MRKVEVRCLPADDEGKKKRKGREDSCMNLCLNGCTHINEATRHGEESMCWKLEKYLPFGRQLQLKVKYLSR